MLKFDRTYIVENTNAFKSYPVTNPGEDTLDEYCLCLFDEDHEPYNEYLGRQKKEENDRRDKEMRSKLAAARMIVLTLVSMILKTSFLLRGLMYMMSLPWSLSLLGRKRNMYHKLKIQRGL